jgi:RNA polymerase sigma-70 factor (ECF subfamily)
VGEQPRARAGTKGGVNIRSSFAVLPTEVVLNEAAVPLPFPPARADAESSARGRASVPALAEAARAGDEAAFAELYRAHLRMVHGVLLARVPRTDVDDLAQDVFLTAWRRIDSLREPAAFPGWLATIARNHATDHLRQRPADADALPEHLPAPGSDGHMARAALDAIRALPEAYRETLVLRLVEGMTGPEIAARTGLTEGSVRVNLHRGMKLLRARLEGRADP